jgi:2-polyprenyl-3-methyl-5-hydroxy-6-metoxy-1,4-benzoquinol methylase
MNHNKRLCPICRSNNNSLIKKINFSLFEGHPMQGGYNLVQCQDCSFIYADTKVTQVELDDYYSNLSKYESKEISTGGGYNEYDRNRLVDTAQYIASRFDDKELAIADVGCAIGGLLEQLKNEGFDNITGIDPSISCVNITKNEKGINCLHASLFELDDSFGKYDLVILSHVWEHILDLEAALKSIEKILKPNGCIYVECPNAMNYKNLIHAPYQEFNTEHINHFSKGSFYNFFGSRGYALMDSGIRIMKIASNNDYDAVYSLFRKNLDGTKTDLVFDQEILPSIQAYLNASDETYEQIIEKIETVGALNEDIAFVGIGQFAFKLLESVKELGIKNKLMLFDNNTLNEGKVINESIVHSGKNLISHYKTKKFNIIITSLIYQNEIANNLKSEFVKNNLEAPLICKLS